MRMGYLVLPPDLLARYRTQLRDYACTVPSMEQHVLARFLSGGWYEQHLSRMRNEYRTRRAHVLAAFENSTFSHKIALLEQVAGLHFLLRLKTDLPDEVLRQRAESLGVALAFLSEFANQPSPTYAHTLVINYAGLEEEQLPSAMELLEQVFSKIT